MHRNAQRLLQPCLACLEQTAARIPRGLQQRRTNNSLVGHHSSLKNLSLSSRFSTSANVQVIRAMTLDDLNLDGDNHNTPNKPRTQDRHTTIAPTSASTISSLASTDIEVKAAAGGEKTSRFLDLTIIPPEQIKQYRALADTINTSSTLQEHEHLISVYRSIADDPKLLPQLQPKDFMQAMNSCRDMYRVVPRMRQILTDFEKSRQQNNQQQLLIPEIYDILLRAFVKLSDFRSATNLIGEMRRKRGLQFGTSTYHIMLDLCKHERNLERARRLLKEMRDNKVEITSATYQIMLAVCGQAKNPQMAREYFDEMPLLGIDTDVNHYNALMNAYAHAKKLDGAKEVFEMMEEDGIPADQYTYAALIKALKGAHRTHEPAALIQTMRESGIQANVKILSALGMDSIEIMKDCMANNVEMKVGDFNTLITRALRSNQFAKVPIIMQEMQERGIRPDVVTFTAMIDANIKMSKFTEAREVFRAMEHANIQPDVIAYSAMIAGALSHSTVQESIEILKDMINDGILPNRHTFNSLLSASVGEIGSDGLMVIRETMAALGVQPDRRSFNAIMSSHALEGDMDQVRRTLADMRRSKIDPDALTYSVLISGYLQNGDLRYAMEWYYTMLDGGFKPAPFVVNNLMSALHGSGQGTQILVLWREMTQLGIRKNERSYEIMFDVCDEYNFDEQRPAIEEEFKTYLAHHPE
ncbi:hypothetical protein K457DRAFT_122040 [Linnemannia elongata AG-77]|uniref:Pentacotripeptide-repeat region of PRORP domain-containing protein n=1 Tax=Linnemannia elongata AG-77 TaxID=1314771 RepID=A0A197K8P2_9FUNG|nr:hypothetical protein K457DRAFT_122040 [Linnemannia elongata AG-77]